MSETFTFSLLVPSVLSTNMVKELCMLNLIHLLPFKNIIAIYLHPRVHPSLCPPSWFPFSQFLIPFLLSYARACFPLPSSRHPLSLEPQISGGLGSSSPTEARPDSPLLYMCWEPWTSPCMLTQSLGAPGNRGKSSYGFALLILQSS